MTKVRKYTISSAAALAVAAGLSLATVPAEAAAIVTYTGCASTSFCTLTELFAGGSIKIDENGDNTFDKLFDTWTNGKEGMDTIPSMVSDAVTVTGFGTPSSAGLQYDAGAAAFSQNFTAAFGYKVTAISPFVAGIVGAKLDLTNSTATGGSVNAVQILDGYTGSFGTANNGVFDSNTMTPDVFTSSTSWTTASPVNVSTMLNGTAFGLNPPLGTGPGTSNITQFRQTFSQATIPEPGTVVGLLVVSSLGLGMKRKQKDN
jgi:hypothetical protein